MRWVSSASSGDAKMQSSTPVACSEKIAKFVPSPSQVAPSGYGVPGQTRRLGTGTPEHEDGLRLRGDGAAGRRDGAGPAEARVGRVEQHAARARERHGESRRLPAEVQADGDAAGGEVTAERPDDGRVVGAGDV